MGTTSRTLPSHPTLSPPIGLSNHFQAVRNLSATLCDSLVSEDFVLQSMPDASPTRWHLAHTTWFFEAMVLQPNVPGYEPYNEQFLYLFNSYYNALGDQFPRPQRGLLSRPTVGEIFGYREYVDAAMRKLLATLAPGSEVARVIEIGLHHEQQHQELMLTDLKHAFSLNPLFPVYREREVASAGMPTPLTWLDIAEGVYEIGFSGEGVCYDNEMPRHRVFVEDFAFAQRLVTAGEYLDFITDGGYDDPRYWLSAGWTAVQEHKWRGPLYWYEQDGQWLQFTLSGLRPVLTDEPVCHISYFEADAYARWAGLRLPTEMEWEIACQQAEADGNFVEDDLLHPAPAGPVGGLRQMFGDTWEWTRSQYSPYPGYEPPDGALGEYNGKFMCNQFVLRGGSCVTSRSHIRSTYRNFFQPDARWQFSGLRLARDSHGDSHRPDR